MAARDGRLARENERAQAAAGYDVVNRHMAVQLVNDLSVFAQQGTADASTAAPITAAQGVITAAPRHTSDARAQQALGDAMAELDVLTAAARYQLWDLGAVVVPNSGAGLNCLIISLLQHATCTYADDAGLLGEAQAIRQSLQLGDDMLLPDDPNFARLVVDINRRHPEARLNVTIAQAWERGQFAPVNHNVDLANANPVLLLQGSNHYEAVTMRAWPAGGRQQRQQWLREDGQRLWPRHPEGRSNAAHPSLLPQQAFGLDNAVQASGSGARVGHIERNPKINPPALPREQQQWLENAQRACPRGPNEAGLPYARRLLLQDPRLSNAALVSGSGANVGDIAADTTINPPALSDKQQQWLDAAKRVCPRDREWDMSNVAYAFRLKQQDPRLSNTALAKGSGATVSRIEWDPKINPPELSPDQQRRLEAAKRSCWRDPAKSKSDLEYARVLKGQDPRLENAALAAGSGSRIERIEGDPMINPPALSHDQQQRLEYAQQARPRWRFESAVGYARRLYAWDPLLELAALAAGSGSRVDTLEGDPKINPPWLPDEQQQRLDAAKLACPRDLKKEKSNLAYARRLKEQDPHLEHATLASGSGARISDIAANTTINPPLLPDEQQQRLDDAKLACPRYPEKEESDLAYARRLRAQAPLLSHAALAKGSGAMVANIKRAVAKWTM
jgi:hypothetical protein